MATPEDAPTGYRERLLGIYEAHAPDKIHQVDALLRRYEGREEALLAAAGHKYGSRAAVTPDASSISGGRPQTPTTAPNASYHERLTRLYEAHNPRRVPYVARDLGKYPGREEEIISAAVKKYGPEPGLTGGGPEARRESAPSTEVAVPPTAPSPSYRERVTAIYTQYAPQRLHRVDHELIKYKGCEEALIRAIESKYVVSSNGLDNDNLLSNSQLPSASLVVAADTPDAAAAAAVAPSHHADPSPAAIAETGGAETAAAMDEPLATPPARPQPDLTSHAAPAVGMQLAELGVPALPPVAPPVVKAPTAVAAAASLSYRDRVMALCTQYAPQRLHRVDHDLEKYQGREEALIRAIDSKYASNSDPGDDNTDSSMLLRSTSASAMSETPDAAATPIRHADTTPAASSDTSIAARTVAAVEPHAALAAPAPPPLPLVATPSVVEVPRAPAPAPAAPLMPAAPPVAVAKRSVEDPVTISPAAPVAAVPTPAPVVEVIAPAKPHSHLPPPPPLPLSARECPKPTEIRAAAPVDANEATDSRTAARSQDGTASGTPECTAASPAKGAFAIPATLLQDVFQSLGVTRLDGVAVVDRATCNFLLHRALAMDGGARAATGAAEGPAVPTWQAGDFVTEPEFAALVAAFGDARVLGACEAAYHVRRAEAFVKRCNNALLTEAPAAAAAPPAGRQSAAVMAKTGRELRGGFWVHRCLFPCVRPSWKRCWAFVNASPAAAAGGAQGRVLSRLSICFPGSAKVDLSLPFDRVLACFLQAVPGSGSDFTAAAAVPPQPFAKNGLVLRLAGGPNPLEVRVCCEAMLHAQGILAAFHAFHAGVAAAPSAGGTTPRRRGPDFSTSSSPGQITAISSDPLLKALAWTRLWVCDGQRPGEAGADRSGLAGLGVAPKHFAWAFYNGGVVHTRLGRGNGADASPQPTWWDAAADVVDVETCHELPVCPAAGTGKAFFPFVIHRSVGGSEKRLSCWASSRQERNAIIAQLRRLLLRHQLLIEVPEGLAAPTERVLQYSPGAADRSTP